MNKRFKPNEDPDALRQKGLYVDVVNNDVNRAMRKLKKIIAADGLHKELREREYHKPGSVLRKEAKARAKSRNRRAIQERKELMG